MLVLLTVVKRTPLRKIRYPVIVFAPSVLSARPALALFQLKVAFPFLPTTVEFKLTEVGGEHLVFV